jgi:surface carbohydrate biosynthesis protein
MVPEQRVTQGVNIHPASLAQNYGETVVILVDDKKRDLNGCTLIARHLRDLGVETKLEPLEAFRAVLAAYRPGMIIFNHLTASHLAAWSRRLADMGVLTAVLPNEGIIYDEGQMRFMAGRYHNDAHIDYYFCWNEPHRRALIEEGLEADRIKVVGVPRFDFYFRPWSQIYEFKNRRKTTRPRILVCTNFQLAKFWELPRSEGERIFAPWAKVIPLLRDYWRGIGAHWRSRTRFLEYLNALVESDKFEVVLRPHPREQLEFYEKWIAPLPPEKARHVDYQPTIDISTLILDCDLEISCETCTTAIESWIARKPTVELIFERDPMWYRAEHAAANVECDDPDELVGIVEAALRAPEQPEKRDTRLAHLQKWCSNLSGEASLEVARIAAEAIKLKKPSDWSKLEFGDYRRAWKLKFYASLDRAYHFDPLLRLKRMFFGSKYALAGVRYEKSIKPSDVRRARDAMDMAVMKLESSR